MKLWLNYLGENFDQSRISEFPELEILEKLEILVKTGLLAGSLLARHALHSNLPLNTTILTCQLTYLGFSINT